MIRAKQFCPEMSCARFWKTWVSDLERIEASIIEEVGLRDLERIDQKAEF